MIHDQGFLDKSDFEWLLHFFGKDNVFIATQEEMTQMNCNVFSISKDVVISEQNFTRLNTWLAAQGFTVEKVPYAEISKTRRFTSLFNPSFKQKLTCHKPPIQF